MAKVGVRWLEPKRDVGKTTFVLKKDIICDKTKDLPAGSIVRAKWKSSGRIYRARLLSPLRAKFTRKNVSSASKPTESLAPAPENSLTTQYDVEDMDDDMEDDIPLSVAAKSLPSTSRDKLENNEKEEMGVTISDMKKTMEEMKTQMNAFRDEMQMEMAAAKRKYEVEVGTLKTVVETLLREVQTDVARQITSVLDAVSELHGTQRETHDIIVRRITAKQTAQQKQVPVAVNDGKRKQIAFGRIESGHVVSYKDDKKVLSVSCDAYSKMFYNSKTPSSFMRKLLKESFSAETLAESNFNGGEVTSINGNTVKKCLDRDLVLAVFGQVELEFPGSTSGVEAFGKLREAVNEECRTASRKIRLHEN